MLKKFNIFKILLIAKLFFITLLSDKFLIVNIKNSNEYLYIKIPSYIQIIKHHDSIDFCFVLNKKLKKKKNLFDFYNFTVRFQNFLYKLNIIQKKKLILKGLGLNLLKNDEKFFLKLGYSKPTIYIPKYTFFNVTIKKFGLRGFFISFFGYNSISLGNLVERIYCFKKADVYKCRGFYYKEKLLILKPIKKN